LAVLSADYFSIPDEEIKELESVLTLVGGKVVYAAADFSQLAPPALPVSPDWSPVKEYGGYAKRPDGTSHCSRSAHVPHQSKGQRSCHLPVLGDLGLWELSCDCFAL